MLTIQPGLVNNYSRNLSFGRSDLQRYAEDVEYEDVTDSHDSSYYENYGFDMDRKKELDLWKQTKANVDAIAKSTENVPGVKTGTKILSGLTAVAIGWGGLRWGTVGTLEVLSKIGKTDSMQSIGKKLVSSWKYASTKFSDLGKYISGKDWYKNSGTRIKRWENSFLDTSVGNTLTRWQQAVKENSLYHGTVNLKNKTVNYFKNLNYKRVFVETMGVAGGGTAAINVLGGKTIDGRTQNVEVNKDGKYFVNDREYIVGGDVSDAA